MEIGTFGGIMRFAIGLEERAAVFYEAQGLGLPEELQMELAKSARKRIMRLERARREGVAEFILEAISGVDSEVYHLDLDMGGDANPLHMAITMEELAARFYRDVAAILPLREISRLFMRLASGSSGNAQQLRTTSTEGGGG